MLRLSPGSSFVLRSSAFPRGQQENVCFPSRHQPADFLSHESITAGVCLCGSLSLLLLKLVFSPSLSLSLALSFLLPGLKCWLKEQNRTKRNVLASAAHKLSSPYSCLPAWSVFVFIHLQVFLIFLSFGLSKQSFAVVWLFGPFAQGFGRNFPDAVTYHKS